MGRLDRHIQEAIREPSFYVKELPCQLSLGLTPCMAESVGFMQVCRLADAARRLISHQLRMYYREEFHLWYSGMEAYLHGRQVPYALRLFLADPIWNRIPPQIGSLSFPSMRELVFLTFIVEERGYPVWTPECCEKFFYRLQARKTVSRLPLTGMLRSAATAGSV